MSNSYGPSKGSWRAKNVRHSPTNSPKSPHNTRNKKKNQKGKSRMIFHAKGKNKAQSGKYSKDGKRQIGVKGWSNLQESNHKYGQNKKAILRAISTHEFRRNFYCPSKAGRNLSQETISQWFKQHAITIRAGYSEYINQQNNKKNKKKNRNNNRHKDIYEDSDDDEDIYEDKQEMKLPNPVLEFDHVRWPDADDIATNLKQCFQSPTPIQSATWPLLLSGLNVIGIAKTGSGKTLAFLLPAIVHMRAQPYCDHPKVLIVLPTRELAVQVEAEIEKFASDVRHVCVYGGAKEQAQIKQIRDGTEILVATPGRLFDFIGRRMVNLGKVTFVVWDEADRLLDMGFTKILDKIMECVRADKQMLMYSATWPQAVRKCAAKHLLDDIDGDANVVQVAIGSMDNLKANENVSQTIIFMDSESEKKQHLKQFVEDNPMSKILVFCRLKRKCKTLAHKVSQRWATSISGAKTQSQRERALEDFRSGEKRVMVATDVAGRGIHIDDIEYVINYDLPIRDIEDYIHRIGRTGRAGKKGAAISYFVEEFDGHIAQPLAKVLRSCNQKVPRELLQMDPTKKRKFKQGGGGNDRNMHNHTRGRGGNQKRRR